MDIKLTAKLSAYSRVSVNSSSDSQNDLPDCTILDSDAVLGVSSSGSYTLFPKISKEDVDTLFEDITLNGVVTKDEIDTLFDETGDSEKTVTKEDIDTLFEADSNVQTRSVTHEEIDSLFNTKK